LTHNFSPEVHVLAGTLVPIVKADSLGGLQTNRHHASAALGRCKNLHKIRALNFTSSLLEWLLALRLGISPRTPHKSPGDDHEQLPTRSKTPLLL
jgi:hypothetical protein